MFLYFFATAEGGNENVALLAHIEEVRNCQVAVCETAQIVQEQVTKLIASRAQLEAHRAALHHHLTSITKLLSSKNNHFIPSTTTTSHGYHRVTSIPSLSTSICSSSGPTALITSVANSGNTSGNEFMDTVVETVQSGNTTHLTSSSLNRTSSSLVSSVPSSFITTNALSTNPSSSCARPTILPPSATVISWTGLPFLTATSIPSSATKENPSSTVAAAPPPPYFPHLIPHKAPSITTNAQLQHQYSNNNKPIALTTPKNVVTNRTLINSDEMTNKIRTTTKGTLTNAHQTTTGKTSKFNGATACSSSTTFSNKSTPPSTKIVSLATLSNNQKCSPQQQGSTPLKLTSPSNKSSAIVGSGSISGVYSTNPKPYIVNHHGTSSSTPSNINNSSSSSANNKSLHKSPIGFTPYSKSSPNRIQPSWLPN